MPDTLTKTRIRTLAMMDESGHTSFGWDETDDAWVLPMIRAKMEAGYVFWIVRRNPLREMRLERVEDLRDSRHVIIRDDSARELFEGGRIGLITDEDGDEADVAETVRRARTAREVVENDTVAHRPLRGG